MSAKRSQQPRRKSFLSRRYIGIDLSGAKNQKTTLAVLEHYPKEGKTFLLDTIEGIGPNENGTGDQNLLKLIREVDSTCIAVNAPLDFPPCASCVRKTCPLPGKCTVPTVKWMRDTSRTLTTSQTFKEFTPYTQRPVEIWLRKHVWEELEEEFRFDIDETLGGTKAPLTARMNFLMRQLGDQRVVEVSPKLSIACLFHRYDIQDALFSKYRDLEKGAAAREGILDSLSDQGRAFIYEKDVIKLSKNLGAFDAFICAYTALLIDLDEAQLPPKRFPAKSGWVYFPKLMET